LQKYPIKICILLGEETIAGYNVVNIRLGYTKYF